MFLIKFPWHCLLIGSVKKEKNLMHYVYCTLRLNIPCFQTTTELRSKYSKYLDINGYKQSPMKTNGFDAIWAAAKALNASIEHLYPNETLDQFSYGNERMARLLFDSLTKLQFEGASVRFGCDSFGKALILNFYMRYLST